MKPNGSAEVFLTCRCGATITAQLIEMYEPWRDVNQLSFEAEGWFVDFYTDKPDDTIVRCPQHNRIVSGRP